MTDHDTMGEDFTPEDAILMALTELVPGDMRDLSDALRAMGGVRPLLSGEYDRSERGAALVSHLRDNLTAERVRTWGKRLATLRFEHPDVSLVTIGDARYPENLRHVFGPPPFLFIKGRFAPSDHVSLAIVGNRNASTDGAEAAHEIARRVGRAGVVVVSGLARGIDSAAHDGALESDGRTIAVLGHGIDSVYPPENSPLALRIARRGCLVSQFKPGAPPTRSTFPARNAVISGLSLASLIIEAQERGGARNEADHAIRQRRPMLLWGPILGNALWAQHLADQADVFMVRDVEEILKIVNERASAASRSGH